MYGSERALLETIDALLLNDDCEIHVVIPNVGVGVLHLELVSRYVNVHVLNTNFTNWCDVSFSKWRFIWQNIVLFKTVFVLLSRIKPEIVIINSIVNSPVYAFCSMLHGIKVIWHIHEFAIEHGYQFLFGKKISHDLIGLLSNTIIFNSESTKKAFLISSKKSIVVKNAVTQVFINENWVRKFDITTKWNIILVGRTSEGKRQLDLVKSIGIIIHQYKYTNIKVTIVGVDNSPYSVKLSNEIAQLGLTECVELVPFIVNVNEYYKHADIGVMTSEMEAFGRVTVEYLKCGLMVIGASTTGTAEILSDFKEEAWLYECGDAQDLAKQLMNVFNTPPNELQARSQSQMVKAQSLYNLDGHYMQFKQAIQLAIGDVRSPKKSSF